MKKKNLVEICRSFSYKLSLPKYESRDFFCSQKSEVSEDKAEETSEKLYEFVKNEVIKSVNRYLAETLPDKERQKMAGLEVSPDYKKPIDATQWDEKKEELYQENSQLDDINKEINQ